METYLKLRLPSSLPYLFAAFRISIPLSVIGAVVGEWFSGDRGLGSVIIVAHSNLDMPTLFSAILVLAFIGITLTVITTYVERKDALLARLDNGVLRPCRANLQQRHSRRLKNSSCLISPMAGS